MIRTVFLLLAIPTISAAELADRFAPSDPASTIAVDHSLWASFLDKHVRAGADGINRVDYAAIRGASREQLESYIAQLGNEPLAELAPREQFALWANLYNALTIRVIADHYPVDSIRDISAKQAGGSRGFSLFSRGPWKAKLIAMGGVELSLDDIEHEILRPIFDDNRVHYAVNCASVGCPNLQPTPFTGAALDEQLDAAAQEYVNHPRGITTGKRVIASSIYDWYQGDFGDSEEGVLEHMRRYANAEKRARLQATDEIDSYAYDWSLNDVKP